MKIAKRIRKLSTVSVHLNRLMSRTSLTLVSLITVFIPPLISFQVANAYSDGTWSPVKKADLPYGSSYNMVKLSNGDVFASGINQDDTNMVTSIYKRNLNKWIDGPTLLGIPLADETITPLSNQKALLAGGQVQGVVTGDAYIFDEVANTIVKTSSMSMVRTSSASVALTNSKVLVIGGINYDNPNVDPGVTAEIYDPSTQLWSSTANQIPCGAPYSSAILLADGKILVDCGIGGQMAIYNPLSNLWNGVNPYPYPRYSDLQQGIYQLPNGKVMVVPGHKASNELVLNTQLWDETTDTWSDGAPLPITQNSRFITGATQLADGDILQTLSDGAAFVYRANSDSWVQTVAIPTGAYWVGINLNSGKTLITDNDSSSYLYGQNPIGSQDTTAPVVNQPNWSATPLDQSKKAQLKVIATDDNSGVLKGVYCDDNTSDPRYCSPLSYDGLNLVYNYTAGSLPTGTYTYYIYAQDGAGNWSQPVRTDIVVYQGDPSIIVGATKAFFSPVGQTSDSGDMLPFAPATNGKKAKINFGIHYKANGTLAGNLKLQYSKDSNNQMTLTGINYDWLIAQSATDAKFTGNASLGVVLNGVQTTQVVKYLVTVFDGSAISQPDHIVVKIYNASDDVLHSSPIYQLSGNVQSGDIAIQGIPYTPPAQ